MTAQEYIKAELYAGRLTLAHIEGLVRVYQARGNTLVTDGKPGDLTRASIERSFPELFPKPPPPIDPRAAAPFLSSPLPLLKAGPNSPQVRKAVITSSFRPKDRPNHNGCDFFYKWDIGDEPKFIGDGGCAGKDLNGNPKWVVPYDTYAVAAAAGVVMLAGPSPTGFRCWVDHGNGLRSGYFHLESLCCRSGNKVRAGDPLGLIGHNPQDNDARHLHFEVSPVDRYEPLDPERYLK